MTAPMDPPQAFPMRVLLVEDDDGDAKAVRRAFQKLRISNPILRVRDGVEALSWLRGEAETGPEEPLFLLVDINMPRMSGLELVREIRADPGLDHHIVFMLTTSGDPFDIRNAYASQVAGYVLKQDAGRDFLKLVSMLDEFWTCIQKPLGNPYVAPGAGAGPRQAAGGKG